MKKQQQLGKQAKNGPKSSSEKPAEQTSSVPQSTFTRSLSDIIKDNKQQKRNDKPSRSIPDRQQRKKEEPKGEPQKVDFGVKSLDQILKEKQDKEKEGGSNKKESDKSNSPQVEPKKNLSNSRVDELRKKNEQKFKTPTTQAVPKANEVPSPTTTSTAPKEAPKRVRDTPTSPKVEPTQKKFKVVEAPKTTPATASLEELPDFNDDLDDLGIELDNTDNPVLDGQDIGEDEDLDAIINS